MNKRERVLTALNGRPVDQIPFTLWRHHYAQDRVSNGLARATLDFYRRFDPDLIVMTPGPFYMAEAWNMDIRSFGSDEIAHYIVSPTIKRATDWRHLHELDIHASSLAREIEAVRLTKAQLTPDDAPLMVTLFSPLTTADILTDGRAVEDLRSFSNDLRSGLAIIAQATGRFARACVEGGADGFILVNRMASQERIRRREYRDFVQEFDLQVLEPLANQAQILVLSLEGQNLLFDAVNAYPVQAVHWETWRADPSIASARRQVRCGLMGGLNPATFVNGSVRHIQEQIADALAQADSRQILIAPSGPLPPNAQDELIASVRKTILGG